MTPTASRCDLFYKKKKERKNKKHLKLKKIFLGIFTDKLAFKKICFQTGWLRQTNKKSNWVGSDWEKVHGISSVFFKAKYVNAEEGNRGESSLVI